METQASQRDLDPLGLISVYSIPIDITPWLEVTVDQEEEAQGAS